MLSARMFIRHCRAADAAMMFSLMPIRLCCCCSHDAAAITLRRRLLLSLMLDCHFAFMLIFRASLYYAAMPDCFR